MICISERAGEALENVLVHTDTAEGECVRLAILSGHVGLEIDKEHLGDEIYSYHGRKVLVVDPRSAEVCTGKMLDCRGEHFCLLDEDRSSQNGQMPE